MSSAEKTYMILIRLANENVTQKHLRENGPLIKAVIEKYSQKDCQLVFTSPDGSTFGWLLNTEQPLGKLKAALYGKTKDTDTSPLFNGDSFLGMELGKDFEGTGFSNGWTWLQHHQR
ncbi:hypothetical protein EQH76_24665 [Pseudomonas aeruginosa]|uniref:hypothetical protein n=1 Tax=Pseudomonas aeruginosa TaxID=287 RepID=UPI000FF6839B|nr:hypothetical protein [Pseudomonas aeruginosa]RWY20347.1 hypothetical protein EQH76_24665 [Pseudomonas aeruginosa]